MIEMTREAYWLQTYLQMHARPETHVDYPSAEEQIFNFGACLIAAGAIEGRRCLDAGCGKGAFGRMLHALGASDVVGIDFIEPTIQQLRRSTPACRWECGSLTDLPFIRTLDLFDLVFAVEVLQCAPDDGLQNLWSAVRPSGRLIGVVPNAANEFVQRRCNERPGLYTAPTAHALIDQLHALPGVVEAGVMGFKWRADRTTVLYDLLPLTSRLSHEECPKRLLFVVTKQCV